MSRAGSRGMVVTERDLLVLQSIGRHQYLSTEQIARDFFPSQDRARRRLFSLSVGGFIDRFVIDSRHPNVHRLTRRGVTFLENAGTKTNGIILPRRAPSLLGLTHQLTLADTLLYLEQLGVETPEIVSVRWRRGRDPATRSLGLSAWKLVPDAVARLEYVSGQTVVGIEVDCGTEGAPILRKKWERYQEAMDAGVLGELWVIVEASDSRLRRIGVQVESAGIADRARLMSREHTLARPPRTPAARGQW